MFKEEVEIKKKQRGQNSFVAPHKNNTYQFDIFISPDDIEATQKFRAGLAMIDNLSKYAVVVPIKSKNPPDIIAGTMEGFNPTRNNCWNYGRLTKNGNEVQNFVY